MKKMMSYSIFVLAIFLTACGHKIENAEKENYTPPAIIYQPKMYYPVEAQENSFSGKTKVVVMVSKKGVVDRAVVIKSSGHEILDKTVMDYCRGLKFNPAYLNGAPIDSRVIWEVNFNFLDQKKNVTSYINAVQKLYLKAKFAFPGNKPKFEREILDEHTAFIKRMNDAINFNIVLEQVIKPELAGQWKQLWNSWPLSFLLYEDFIERFPDYDSLSVVKQLLKNAVSFDIKYLQSQSATDPTVKKNKENLLTKIKQFVQSKYPDLVFENGEADASIDLKNR